jgi:hypothetical protein
MNFAPRLAVALALSYAAAAPALAALGGTASSVEADNKHMRGTTQVSSALTYNIHEITTPQGTTVREYVSADGRVFGVAWRGPFMPDLQQLLGTYYKQFEDAASSPHAGHRHVDVALPGLVVHSAGRMRAFYGRAWAPDLVPESVSVDEIR